MTKIKDLIIKYQEIILYFIFGVLTTIVNLFTFWAFTKILGEELYLINNGIAWVVGVVFSFVTNKLFVFASKSWNFKTSAREFIAFVGARLFSLGVEEGGMWFFIELLNFGEKSLSFFGITVSGQILAKFPLAVIVVLLNYFFSKFFIFRKNKNKNQGEV
ncbi:MAG: GtrA family protein [Acutalibacteraceae bacterium]